VKKPVLVLNSSLFLFSILVIFGSCKKINEATTLGGDLIPAVDNISTFEAFLETGTTTNFFNDSTPVSYSRPVALGYLNDPLFGTTKADVYFNVAPAGLKVNPFYNLDSVQAIDSVVLSLAYSAFYGDSNAVQTVSVFEIAPTATFNDTSVYRYSQPEFALNAMELGSKSFAVKDLNDSFSLIRKRDTVKTGNVLRIPLSNFIGERFKTYDTTTGPQGGFRTDSIFYTLFKGLAIQSKTSGNALAYFNLSDNANTKLTVYFQVIKNGKRDTLSADFYHVAKTQSGVPVTHGTANLIKRDAAGTIYGTAVETANNNQLYIQSLPGNNGSFGAIKIPGLDTFKNSIIHRAELVVSKIATPNEGIFATPLRLFLDRKKSADSVSVFQKDILDLSGNLNSAFGGSLESDDKYRFNITRYVQDVVTGREENDSLRLFAPIQVTYRVAGSPFIIPVNSLPTYGRVVLGGGAYPEPAQRLRLRIVYSKIN